MRSSVIMLAALAVVGVAPAAQAQLLDQLKGAAGSSALPSVGQQGAGNTAGVLQYCVQNNYLDGKSADSVRNSLMSHVPGQSSDSSYRQGSQGVVETGTGQNYNLGGTGSLKEQATRQLCDQVLKHGRSLL
jgi:Protein of unknown function (DUF2501)